MNRAKALGSYARLLALKGSAWTVVAEGCCQAALWAFSHAREADECASIVADRALAARGET